MKSDEERREFKGVWVPKEIWLSKELTALEKVLLTEIDSLSGGELGCIKSNESLAEFCVCSARTITRALAKLRDMGLVEETSFNGRQRVLRSCLGSIDKLSCQYGQDVYAATQLCPPIYVDSNPSSNPPSNPTKKPRQSKPKKSEPSEEVKEIIDYLNERLGTRYTYGNKEHLKLINGRLSEGFSTSDFRMVIDTKASQWMGDRKMEQFLRPTTLFAPSHFEEYLNESISQRRAQRDYSEYNLAFDV